MFAAVSSSLTWESKCPSGKRSLLLVSRRHPGGAQRRRTPAFRSGQRRSQPILQPHPGQPELPRALHQIQNPPRRLRIPQAFHPHIRNAIPLRIAPAHSRLPRQINPQRIRRTQPRPLANQQHHQLRPKQDPNLIPNSHASLRHHTNRPQLPPLTIHPRQHRIDQWQRMPLNSQRRKPIGNHKHNIAGTTHQRSSRTLIQSPPQIRPPQILLSPARHRAPQHNALKLALSQPTLKHRNIQLRMHRIPRQRMIHLKPQLLPRRYRPRSQPQRQPRRSHRTHRPDNLAAHALPPSASNAAGSPPSRFNRANPSPRIHASNSGAAFNPNTRRKYSAS